MDVLVLGGTHFLGRAIAMRLLADGHAVTVFHRGSRPAPAPAITSVLGDRTDPLGPQPLRGRRFDAVVDVSAGPPEMIDHTLAHLAPAPVYVLISTIAVYDGRATPPPFREDDDARGTDPVWRGLGAAKAACEQRLHTLIGDRLVVLRLPYVYGPHNPAPREQFLWARIMRDAPVLVPGDGGTVIQFCHAVSAAATVSATCTGALRPGTYNVADADALTVDAYVDVLGRAAGRDRPRRQYVADRERDALTYFPFPDVDLHLDTDRLARTGHLPRLDLTDGLAATYRWFRDAGRIVLRPTTVERQLSTPT